MVAFGNTLHISGRDAGILKHSIQSLREDGHEWTKIKPGLEDVFIGLMDGTRDTFD